MEGVEHIRAIAWDFDGVLNRAGVAGADGRFRWQHRMQAEFGVETIGLARQVFGQDRRALLTGADDILDRLETWVRDIRFDGRGCAICIASASMMSEAVRGHPVADARALQQRFRAVLTGQTEPEEADLGKLVSLAAVRRYPGRIKCALLGWHALMHALAGAAAVEEDPDIVVDRDPGVAARPAPNGAHR